jgi:Cellulose biosynthesis protein BcsS
MAGAASSAADEHAHPPLFAAPSREDPTPSEARPVEAKPLGAISPDPIGDANTLFFSGLDYWGKGVFFHAGVLWAPAGFTREGFTLKMFGGTGAYRYTAGALGGSEVTGQQLVAALMPGWRFSWDKLELTAYAGLDLQDHRLLPDDRSNRVRGLHAGARVGVDLWSEPSPGLMLAASASIASLNLGYWTRAAAGWRVLDTLWLGPEATALGDVKYWQYRLGLHATGMRIKQHEWSAGAGWVSDSDRRDGFYLRLGLLTRR